MKPKLLGALLFGLALTACEGRSHKAHAPPPPPPAHAAASQPAAAASPVQREMQLLTEALKDAITAIAVDQLDAIPHALHAVHEAKANTAEGIRTGAWKPLKNPDRIARFVELDEAFHGDLERLVAAASRRDHPATAAALGAALSRCNGCHEEFRR